MSRFPGGRLQGAVSRYLPKLSIAVLLLAGCASAAYVIRGWPSAHALINAESAVALSFVVAVCCWPRISKPTAHCAAGPGRWPLAREFLLLPALCAIVAVAYAKILPAPFVFDDYGHITEAARSSWRATLGLFGPADYKPALFFRPFGFLLYRLNYLWAGDQPARWHAGSISMHAIDSWLVYWLCRKLGLARSGSACACLLFAINGCAAEPVAWIDAIWAYIRATVDR